MNRKKIASGVFGGFLLILGAFVLLVNVNVSHPVVQISSCSNYPVLEPGDTVVVKDTAFENIEEGDTVIYREPSNNMTVTHQVVSKSESSLQTRGENNPRQLEFEKDVEESQIWGIKGPVISLGSGSECAER